MHHHDLTKGITDEFDALVRVVVTRLTQSAVLAEGTPNADAPDNNWRRLVALPDKLGGLGITDWRRIAAVAYTASLTSYAGPDVQARIVASLTDGCCAALLADASPEMTDSAIGPDALRHRAENQARECFDLYRSQHLRSQHLYKCDAKELEQLHMLPPPAYVGSRAAAMPPTIDEGTPRLSYRCLGAGLRCALRMPHANSPEAITCDGHCHTAPMQPAQFLAHVVGCVTRRAPNATSVHFVVAAAMARYLRELGFVVEHEPSDYQCTVCKGCSMLMPKHEWKFHDCGNTDKGHTRGADLRITDPASQKVITIDISVVAATPDNAQLFSDSVGSAERKREVVKRKLYLDQAARQNESFYPFVLFQNCHIAPDAMRAIRRITALAGDICQPRELEQVVKRALFGAIGHVVLAAERRAGIAMIPYAPELTLKGLTHFAEEPPEPEERDPPAVPAPRLRGRTTAAPARAQADDEDEPAAAPTSTAPATFTSATQGVYNARQATSALQPSATRSDFIISAAAVDREIRRAAHAQSNLFTVEPLNGNSKYRGHDFNVFTNVLHAVVRVPECEIPIPAAADADVEDDPTHLCKVCQQPYDGHAHMARAPQLNRDATVPGIRCDKCSQWLIADCTGMPHDYLDEGAKGFRIVSCFCTGCCACKKCKKARPTVPAAFASTPPALSAAARSQADDALKAGREQKATALRAQQLADKVDDIAQANQQQHRQRQQQQKQQPRASTSTDAAPPTPARVPTPAPRVPRAPPAAVPPTLAATPTATTTTTATISSAPPSSAPADPVIAVIAVTAAATLRATNATTTAAAAPPSRRTASATARPPAPAAPTTLPTTQSAARRVPTTAPRAAANFQLIPDRGTHYDNLLRGCRDSATAGEMCETLIGTALLRHVLRAPGLWKQHRVHVAPNGPIDPGHAGCANDLVLRHERGAIEKTRPSVVVTLVYHVGHVFAVALRRDNDRTSNCGGTYTAHLLDSSPAGMDERRLVEAERHVQQLGIATSAWIALLRPRDPTTTGLWPARLSIMRSIGVLGQQGRQSFSVNDCVMRSVDNVLLALLNLDQVGGDRDMRENIFALVCTRLHPVTAHDLTVDGIGFFAATAPGPRTRMIQHMAQLLPSEGGNYPEHNVEHIARLHHMRSYPFGTFEGFSIADVPSTWNAPGTWTVPAPGPAAQPAAAPAPALVPVPAVVPTAPPSPAPAAPAPAEPFAPTTTAGNPAAVGAAPAAPARNYKKDQLDRTRTQARKIVTQPKGHNAAHREPVVQQQQQLAPAPTATSTASTPVRPASSRRHPARGNN